MTFHGACHCGAIKVSFETVLGADAIQVRRCLCGFCRRRGGKTVSDPDGRLEFHVTSGVVQRYRFGTGSADFLLCKACGAFLGAVANIDGDLYGVLNVVGADIATLAERPGEPMNYSAEAVSERAQRRRRVWTPAAVVEV